MIYQATEMMRDIRVTLDHNNISAPLLAENDRDALSLDEIIRSKIEEAVRRTHNAAPTYLLESGHSFGDAIYWNGTGSGWILLPDDFMRLVVFRMSDWERSVHTAISDADPAYDRQSSRFRGIRGTPQKPVCAITIRPEGRVLEFYSCRSESAHVAQATYLPWSRIDENGGIDISERCYTSAVYVAAALTAAGIGETEKANTLFELSKSALQ